MLPDLTIPQALPASQRRLMVCDAASQLMRWGADLLSDDPPTREALLQRSRE